MVMLCSRCRARWLKALDAKMPPPPIVLVQIGRPSEEVVAAARHKRADEHYQRINDFQRYLESNCKGSCT